MFSYQTPKNSWRQVAGTAILLFLFLWDIEAFPPLWWDEGWTLNTARNWVENGFYGQLRDDQPRAAGLSAAFPVVGPVALSFRLLGVGGWQGRLPGVLMTLGALALLYGLAERLYNRRIAAGTLVVALLLQNHGHLNPILLGRQVLGEMPALLYLLIGYSLFWLALRRSAGYLAASWLVWGLALTAKGQVLPFWAASLMLPLWIALRKGWRREAVGLFLGLPAGWLASRFWLAVFGWITQAGALPVDPITGLYEITGAVFSLAARGEALLSLFTLGLPTLCGLAACAWQQWRGRQDVTSADIPISLLRWSLLGFAGSALAWFALLAMPFTRYLFWAMLPGSIFVSATLCRWTGGFDLRYTIRQATGVILRQQFNARSISALGVVLMLAMGLPFLGGLLMGIDGDRSSYRIADYLNTHTPSNSKIECYDSEIFFLLERRYHYPPDALHVNLVRRAYLDASTPVVYDPLLADPDYLVVGPFVRFWKLYDKVLQSGAFQLLHTDSLYAVYQRVR